MRRILCLALALLLCFTMVGATAELELMGEINHEDYGKIEVSWAPIGVGLLKIRDANEYYLADVNGTALTEAYGSNFERVGQLMTTSRLDSDDINCKGALNADCEEVIPFEYGRFEELGVKWLVAYRLFESTVDYSDFRENDDGEKYYLTDTVDIYYTGSGNPECVATIPRENYAEAKGLGDTINVKDRATGVVTAYDSQFNALGEVEGLTSTDYSRKEVTTFKDNGREGLMDADGNVILEPTYLGIHTGLDEAECFIAYMGELQGLIDKTGAEIIPLEYDRVYPASLYSPRTPMENYSNAGFYAVEKDGRLGFVVAGGEVTCEPRYPVESLFVMGASATYTDMEGNQHILAADGVDANINDSIDGLESISAIDNGSGVFYEVRKDSHSGLIDFHGDALLPCEYNWLQISPDGNYLIAAGADYNYTVYKLDYEAAGAVAPGDDGGIPALDERIIKVSPPEGQIVEVFPNEGQISEAPAAAEAPAEVSGMEAIEAIGESAEAAPAGATDTAGAAGLVNSAILVLRADAGANGPAAVALLNSALAQLGDEHPASAMLAGAIALLDAGAAYNGAVAISLLESARGMM